MTAMKDKDVVSKGPKRRDETCLEVRHDIVIPAGTILRQDAGKPGTFSCELSGGKFVFAGDVSAYTGSFRKVVA